jgi:hypothetical protein
MMRFVAIFCILSATNPLAPGAALRLSKSATGEDSATPPPIEFMVRCVANDDEFVGAHFVKFSKAPEGTVAQISKNRPVYQPDHLPWKFRLPIGNDEDLPLHENDAYDYSTGKWKLADGKEYEPYVYDNPTAKWKLATDELYVELIYGGGTHSRRAHGNFA